MTLPTAPSLKSLFMLDPEIHFLNHGSFGATPRKVFEVWQKWQRRLELQPVKFLARDLEVFLQSARESLAEYLGCGTNDLLYVPNATFGINLIARSLHLRPGDEVLTSNHEYGACNHAWEFACSKTGARYVTQPIDLPVHSSEEILEQFWRGVTPRTRVIFISQITSPTALRMPVEAICQRARAAGLITVVDAEHSAGQIPLNLSKLDADFVTGNLHKWLMAPKGAAFLFARQECQPLLEPLVVSWGYGETPLSNSGSRFIDRLQWTGTYDPSAALSVPAAIAFSKEQHWDEVRQSCHRLLASTIEKIGELTGLPCSYPLTSDLFAQMGIAALPIDLDLVSLKSSLYDKYRVEVPLIEWNGQKFVRISIQGYNSPEDVEALVSALKDLLKATGR